MILVSFSPPLSLSFSFFFLFLFAALQPRDISFRGCRNFLSDVVNLTLVQSVFFFFDSLRFVHRRVAPRFNSGRFNSVKLLGNAHDAILRVASHPGFSYLVVLITRRAMGDLNKYVIFIAKFIHINDVDRARIQGHFTRDVPLLSF